MRKIGFFFLLLSSVAAAQNTVTATITDADGTVWANGTYAISFQPTLAVPQMTGQTVYAGNLDSNGSFSVSLPTATWNFHITPNASQGGFTVSQSISSTISLTAILSAAAKGPRFPTGLNAFGYTDGEVFPIPQIGGTYFNVTLQKQRTWNGSAWQNGGGGGSGTVNTGSTGQFAYYPGAGTAVSGNSGLSDDGANGIIVAGNTATCNLNGWQDNVACYSGATLDAKLSACLTAHVSTGGMCDARQLGGNQSFASSVTVSTPNIRVLFGQGIISFGANQLLVAQGTKNVKLEGWARNADSNDTSNSTVITYTGTTSPIVVGGNSGDTAGFEATNLTINIASAGSAAQGIQLLDAMEYILRGITTYASLSGGNTQVSAFLSGPFDQTSGSIYDCWFQNGSIGVYFGQNANVNRLYNNRVNSIGGTGLATVGYYFDGVTTPYNNNNQVFGGYVFGAATVAYMTNAQQNALVDVFSESIGTEGAQFSSTATNNWVWIAASSGNALKFTDPATYGANTFQTANQIIMPYNGNLYPPYAFNSNFCNTGAGAGCAGFQYTSGGVYFMAGGSNEFGFSVSQNELNLRQDAGSCWNDGANTCLWRSANGIVDAGVTTASDNVGATMRAASLQACTNTTTCPAQLTTNGPVAPLTTPASSGSTCTAGLIWADASFVYVCTATNTIKRAALSTF